MNRLIAFAVLCAAVGGCGRMPSAPAVPGPSQPAAPATTPVQPIAPAADTQWVDASKAGVKSDDIWVSVIKMEIGKVHYVDLLAQPATSEKDYLKVYIRIDNTSQTRKVDYATWANSGNFPHPSMATLHDNFKNTCKNLPLDLGSQPTGQLTQESIYPGKTVTDLLLFELPVATAETLYLELPPENVGTKENSLKFSYPMKLVGKK